MSPPRSPTPPEDSRRLRKKLLTRAESDDAAMDLFAELGFEVIPDHFQRTAEGRRRRPIAAHADLNGSSHPRRPSR